MPFENIKIVDPYVENGLLDKIKLTLATPDEVDAVEAELNVLLPTGYKEYVTTFGRGQYCNYIRVDMPIEILTKHKEYQNFLSEYGVVA